MSLPGAFPIPLYFKGTGEGRRVPKEKLLVSKYQKDTLTANCVCVCVLEIEFGGSAPCRDQKKRP